MISDFNWTTIASVTVSLSGLIAAIAHLGKQWYNIKKLGERVEALEIKEAQISGDYLTKGEHEDMSAAIQRQIYKDMSALEEKIEAINLKLEKGEAQRELTRAEDLKWKSEMQKTVVEIHTIVQMWKSEPPRGH